MKKRIIALAAVILMLLLASCNSAVTPQESSSDAASAPQSEAPSEAVSDEPSETLEITDLGGKTFVFVVPDSSYVYYESFDIGADESTSDLIRAAVVERNAKIEREFNCKIETVKDKSIARLEYDNVTSSITEYDVYMPMFNEATAYIGSNVFYDLGDAGLQLGNSYWDQSLLSSMTFNGKTFFATGDISMVDNDCTMVMFFNKKMIGEYSLENPYELVKSHKWTLDKVYEMSRKVTKDNGDSVWNNEDTYGLHVAFNAPHSFFFGCGGTIAEKTSDGYALTMNSEKNISILEKVFDVAYANDVVTNKTAGCSTAEAIFEMFSAGRIMFTTLALIDMNSFRDNDVSFGILPYPLYNEEQESYHCLISTSLVPVVTIPSNSPDPKAAGAVVEALGFYSKNLSGSLTSVYYENKLKMRKLKDDESAEMLDIIFEKRVYDPGYIFNWGGIGSLIENMNGTNDRNFVSRYEAIATAAQTAMEKTVDDLNGVR